jgi:predicted nuclease of predicted toxin-antitoxin system
VRFYLDEDLSGAVARIARAQGLDVISSHECGRNGLPDDEQLRLAAADGRCLVTRNAKDFLALTARFFEEGWPHAGMLIVSSSLPNRDFAGIAAALVTYARRHEDDLPPYTTDFLTPATRS